MLLEVCPLWTIISITCISPVASDAATWQEQLLTLEPAPAARRLVSKARQRPDTDPPPRAPSCMTRQQDIPASLQATFASLGGATEAKVTWVRSYSSLLRKYTFVDRRKSSCDLLNRLWSRLSLQITQKAAAYMGKKDSIRSTIRGRRALFFRDNLPTKI